MDLDYKYLSYLESNDECPAEFERDPNESLPDLFLGICKMPPDMELTADKGLWHLTQASTSA